MEAHVLSELLGVIDDRTEIQVELNGEIFSVNTCEISVGGDAPESVVLHCRPSR